MQENQQNLVLETARLWPLSGPWMEGRPRQVPPQELPQEPGNVVGDKREWEEPRVKQPQVASDLLLLLMLLTRWAALPVLDAGVGAGGLGGGLALRSVCHLMAAF